MRHSRSASCHVTIVASVTTMLGNPRNATSAPFKAPIRAPVRIPSTTATPTGNPDEAASPATTAQTLNCAPIEISICRVMITTATATAATRAGICEASRETNGCPSKKFGAKIPSAAASSTSAAPTARSREAPFIRSISQDSRSFTVKKSKKEAYGA